MYTYVATAIAAALVASVGTWQVQNWRYGSLEKNRVDQILADTRTDAASNIRKADNIIAAQNKAVARAVAAQLDADGARSERYRLRDTTDTFVEGARGDFKACSERINTLRVVFDQCGEALEGVARKADAHAIDAQKLSDAWPTSE
ncbi:hypothetical protein [Curvibacter phage PCA1]|nr:hypothetical protein [Curvibacter phage PCA1]